MLSFPALTSYARSILLGGCFNLRLRRDLSERYISSVEGLVPKGIGPGGCASNYAICADHVELEQRLRSLLAIPTEEGLPATWLLKKLGTCQRRISSREYDPALCRYARTKGESAPEVTTWRFFISVADELALIVRGNPILKISVFAIYVPICAPKCYGSQWNTRE